MTGFVFGAIFTLVVGRIVRGKESDIVAFIEKVKEAI